MKLDKLKEFIKFMEDNNLSELEIEEEGKRVRLKKNLPSQPVVVTQTPPTIKKEVEAKKEKVIEIKSPMVGTFYSAASPEAKPYIELGDIIKSGEVVCIIEAMKLMNEIKSEVEGKIAKIPVKNGEPVEFGQSLFIIEPV